MSHENQELPEGWKSSFDKRTQKPFYVNLKTRERTWHRPLLDSEPKDFYRKFDRKSGKIYYVNFATKKTCWKLPPRAVVKDIRELKERQKRNSPPKPNRQQHSSNNTPQRNQPRQQQKQQQQQQQQQQRSPEQQAFEEADTNGDGVLDQSEFAQLIQRAREQAMAPAAASTTSPYSSPSVSAAARKRLPYDDGNNNSGGVDDDNRGAAGGSSPHVHVNRHGDVFISPGRREAPKSSGENNNHDSSSQLDDFPEADDDAVVEDRATGDAGTPDELNVHTTSEWVRRMVAQRQVDDQEDDSASATSRPLYPVDDNQSHGAAGAGNDDAADEPAAGLPQQEQESAAYHGGTHAKSGTSTLSAHVPDKSLATLHHDTESLDQDNKILRAQCGDIRAELDSFKSGLQDSLNDVAELLQTLSGIESRHQHAGATSPRRLRYGREAGEVQPRMAIEDGPGASNAAGANRPSIHISPEGQVTINT